MTSPPFAIPSIARRANRAGGPSPDHRAAIVQALFATRDRDSVLGRYSIDANGDTTLTTYGVFRVRARRLAFAFAIDSAR